MQRRNDSVNISLVVLKFIPRTYIEASEENRERLLSELDYQKNHVNRYMVELLEIIEKPNCIIVVTEYVLGFSIM